MPYGNAIVSRIVSVADGDTFVCDIDAWPPIVGLRVPVRIAGIDALELDDSRSAARALAQRAKQFLESKLYQAKLVELLQISRGKYFRLKAYVLVDGHSISRLMLEHGLALPYEGGKKPAWLNLS